MKYDCCREPLLEKKSSEIAWRNFVDNLSIGVVSVLNFCQEEPIASKKTVFWVYRLQLLGILLCEVFSHLVFKKTFGSKRFFKVFFHFLIRSSKQKLLPKLCFATQMLFKNRTTHCFLIRENTFFITTFHQNKLSWSRAAERNKIFFIHKTHPRRFYTHMEIN